MKQLITTAVLLFSMTVFAQVGINNTSPKATLDITAKTSGTKPEGLIIPQLTGDQIRAATTATPTPVYGSNQKGLIIYATVADSAPSGATANITTPGYYYFDGSVWQKMNGAAAGDTTNDAWINDTTNGLIKLGTKADGTARAAGADFVAKDNGQVGIGTSSPDASAALEVASTNKGMLIPRVALTGSTDQTTIPSPATGLLVYNIGSSGLSYEGYVFWNGLEWRTFNNSSSLSGTIGDINCNSVSITPNTYTAGIMYNGVLSVPYTGGNGGAYAAQTISSTGVTGLTATLTAGNFENGSGILQYIVSGIPSGSSPSLATFAINIGGKTCSASIGDSSNIATETSSAVMGALTLSNDNGKVGYGITATTPDGKFSIRIFVASGQSYGKANVQIRSNLGTPTITWTSSTFYANADASSNGVWELHNNATPFPVANEWCGTFNEGSSTMNRITTDSSDYGSVAFGDRGIGDGGRVEYRRYSWTSTDVNDKTLYEAYITMGSNNLSTIANTTNCPSGKCIGPKGYIRIVQVSSN
ncbi:hypothetical protein [Chryseobacterium lineare]